MGWGRGCCNIQQLHMIESKIILFYYSFFFLFFLGAGGVYKNTYIFSHDPKGPEEMNFRIKQILSL